MLFQTHFKSANYSKGVSKVKGKGKRLKGKWKKLEKGKKETYTV
ncbi:MAG: hypothetical protein V1749_03035 [Candidatus Desantisbacteria bacterium]